MNISYHYHAVKTLALKAGFSEQDAQTVATFSEYVDDFNLYAYRPCSNIPSHLMRSPYDLYVGGALNPLNFNPATTGFWDMIDMATLILDRSQKFTVVPFHFIPRDEEHAKAGDFLTVPARRGDGSYAARFLKQAKEAYWASGRDALMLVGMRLHTFADTHAHQLFSGYNHDCNAVELENVVNNLTGADETAKYRDSIEKMKKKISEIIPGFLPKIGHMLLEHVPDLAHLSFEMRYPMPGGMGIYRRSNTETFVAVSRDVLNTLLECLHKPDISNDEWNTFSANLTKAFLIEIDDSDERREDIATLNAHWSRCFPGYTYEYDRMNVLNGVLGENALDKAMCADFYRYNAYADETLIALYGSQPRYAWYLDDGEN